MASMKFFNRHDRQSEIISSTRKLTTGAYLTSYS
jgi:hypothetical protein